MRFNLVGINHNSAPVAVREKAAAANGGLEDALAQLATCIPDGVILSTCNRTEIYYISPGEAGSHCGLEFLEQRTGLSQPELAPFVYCLSDLDALTHLFRVASGLDSMIIGEYEILSQIKIAFQTAEDAGMVTLPLRKIFQAALGVSRRVRDETGISKNALSVSSIAVELAAEKVKNLSGSEMLVIGAGQAGKLVAKAAKERGLSRIVVASRSLSTASKLAAEIGGIGVSLTGLPDQLANADIIVTCAASPHAILDAAQVADAMELRARRPLVIIDIGVPRNAEAEISRIPGVFLYDLDDINVISEQNRKQRESEVAAASAIIEHEVIRFNDDWQSFEARPVVSALMQKAEEIRRKQLEKTIGKIQGLSDEDRERLESMTRSIVTRILKEPVGYLKSNPDADSARLVSRLFELGEAAACEE